MISKIVLDGLCRSRIEREVHSPSSGGCEPVARARRAALAFFALAAIGEFSAISLAHADCPAIGASADTSTDFDGTI